MESENLPLPEENKPDNFFFRILDRIERVGNAIPNPALLFVALAVLTLILSAVVSWADVSVRTQVRARPCGLLIC